MWMKNEEHAFERLENQTQPSPFSLPPLLATSERWIFQVWYQMKDIRIGNQRDVRERERKRGKVGNDRFIMQTRWWQIMFQASYKGNRTGEKVRQYRGKQAANLLHLHHDHHTHTRVQSCRTKQKSGRTKRRWSRMKTKPKCIWK